MRIVLAPDKFKGCLTAAQVCDAMAAGLRRVEPLVEIDPCPMADGGEGTVDALVSATGGRLITHRVTGPLPEMKVDATFGILGDSQTAVIEMSSASGLALLRPEQYDPLATTTFGTGELINRAVELGCTRIILGIGGSATCDAGIGCAQACGLPVILDDSQPAAPTELLCGRDVERVVLVKRGRGDRFGTIGFVVACDVTNPLYGPNGAAHVYGPQKGATAAVVGRLDAALRRLAVRIGCDEVAHEAGAGAAGGLGFGMMAFFGAARRPGIELVIENTRLRQRLTGANLCLTGEGRLDAQSLSGKTTIGVSRLCRELQVSCVAVVGDVGEGAERAVDEGLEEYRVVRAEGMDQGTSMREAPRLIEDTCAELLTRRR